MRSEEHANMQEEEGCAGGFRRLLEVPNKERHWFHHHIGKILVGQLR